MFGFCDSWSSSDMAHSLTSLAIFQSLIRKEMVRSLHVYGSVEIEREFLFESKSRYVEKKTKPLFRSEDFRRPEISEGSVFDTWRCIFVFRFNHSLLQFPTLLCLSRNPKLEDIPNLANELKFISELKSKNPSKISDQEQCSRVRYCNLDQSQPLKHVFKEDSVQDCEVDQPKPLKHVFKEDSVQDCEVDQPKPLKLVFKEDSVQDCEVDQPKLRKLVLKQDLNCLPDTETESQESENEKTEHSESDGKTEMLRMKRTPSNIVAGLSLEDLSKYFGLTIVEASRNLNVGLTVLKKKCREFGIPRWPHRKIKSLDSLIHDLQREAEKQQEKNEAAAIAVAKRQKKLETEKRNIVERPFMEIQIETKRFRQVNFKKRHRASRTKKNQETLVTSSST